MFKQKKEVNATQAPHAPGMTATTATAPWLRSVGQVALAVSYQTEAPDADRAVVDRHSLTNRHRL